MTEPREPTHTEVHRVADPDATRVASYLAQPGEVGRVLLLYSGGLDTSVMLKWIQDEYEAEVVALTVNLGQPGEDYDVVKGKALQLGALDCHVVDAREEFAREYVAAGDQGQRRLRRRLPAVHRARPAADRQARGRVRAPARAATRSPTAAPARATTRCASRRTVATLAPELKVIAPVRSWAMGRDEEIAYARKHGIPVKGGTEARAVLDRRQPLGPLVGGQVDRGPLARARRRRLPARHAARAGAGRAAGGRGRRSRRACRSRSTASGSGWSS